MKLKLKQFENNFSNYKLYQLLWNPQVKQQLKHKVERNQLELKAKLLLNKVNTKLFYP
jgi:hypothetical protein